MKKQNGKTFYEMTLGDYLLFLLSDSDNWYGISAEPINGYFMYKHKTADRLKPLGVWRKQQDETLFIEIQNDNSSDGYVAELVGNEFWIYDAVGQIQTKINS